MTCKNILIIGGSGDLGQAILRNLQSRSFLNVFSTYSHNPRKNNGCTELKYSYPGINEAFFASLKDVSINRLIHCIGIRSSKKSIRDTDEEEWIRLFGVNVLSFVDVYKHLLPNLRAGNAKIIAVSSSASVDCKANSGAYSVSKAALNALIKTIAEEEKEYGITAQVIMPPLFNSKLACELAVLKGYKSLDEYNIKALNGSLIEADDVALKIINEVM